MINTFESEKDKLVVETRALIDNRAPFVKRLLDLGATKIGTVDITDEYYADLTDVVPEHTYDRVKKAARIRIFKNSKSIIIAVIKETASTTGNIHDATTATYFKKNTLENIETVRNQLKEKGFPDLVTKISKKRDIYKLNTNTICIDNMEGFGPGLEIRTSIKSKSDIDKTKMEQKNFLRSLDIPEADIVEKSLTHMIIDAHIKSDPKVKIPFLNERIKELEGQKRKLMVKSNEYYRNEGDGWHDNSGWDILREEIDVISIRIRNLKEELMEVKKNNH